MRLSVVIPFMDSFPGKQDILEATVKSFTGADEVIIVSNWREGYAKPINKGLKIATGDFIVIMNDDMTWDGGSLKRLCDPEAVTSPVVNGNNQKFWGCCWCIPRWVYEKVGGMYEGYEISYFDDDHTFFTYATQGIPMRSVPGVNVSTQGGTTLDKFPDRNEFFEKNKQHFTEYWGATPEEMYNKHPNR